MKGLLLLDKPQGRTSFHFVSRLRKLTGERCIGHAGTLDPFATGLMIFLISKQFTRLSDTFLNQDKEYVGRIKLGESTESYDIDSSITKTSDYIPSINEVENVVSEFQGEVEQFPPMYSAKKVNGKKLYTLARKGISIERDPKKVILKTDILNYEYPFLDIKVSCSKGTYIRTIAYDIGQKLKTEAHLYTLQRTKCGDFNLTQSVDGKLLESDLFDPTPYIFTNIL